MPAPSHRPSRPSALATDELGVVVVHESALVRKELSSALARDAGIRVVGTASDSFSGRDQIVKLRPAVVLLDLEMPRMDGLTFLQKLLEYLPVRVIVVASGSRRGSELGLEALSLGAVDLIEKPTVKDGQTVLAPGLPARVRAASLSRVDRARRREPARVTWRAGSVPASGEFAIVVAASAASVPALEFLLASLPRDCPAILVTTHLAEPFVGPLVQRLGRASQAPVSVARPSEHLEPGRVVVASGAGHLVLRRGKAGVRAELVHGPRVSGKRPSADVLFESAAAALGGHALGVLLGSECEDGAIGLAALRRAGAVTLVESEASAVAPLASRSAMKADAATFVHDLEDLPAAVVTFAARAEEVSLSLGPEPSSPPSPAS